MRKKRLAKIETDRKAKEQKLKDEQEAFRKEKEEFEAEKRKKQEAERLSKEKEEAQIQAVKDAEEKAKQEAETAKRIQAEKEAEEKRQLALRPDKEKLEAGIKAIKFEMDDDFHTTEGKLFKDMIPNLLEVFKKELIAEIPNL